MTARDIAAAAMLAWLIGAIVGWCAGWAGRGEENRAIHAGVVRRLAHTQARLADALDELDDARAAQWQAQQLPAPGPLAVHVHVAASLPWPPPPMVTDTRPFFTTMPVLPVQEITP